jgi:hypothetical protein
MGVALPPPEVRVKAKKVAEAPKCQGEVLKVNGRLFWRCPWDGRLEEVTAELVSASKVCPSCGRALVAYEGEPTDCGNTYTLHFYEHPKLGVQRAITVSSGQKTGHKCPTKRS